MHALSTDVVVRNVIRNPPVAFLYEQALLDGSGHLAQGGSLVVSTGAHTGRSPNDRFIVRQPLTESIIDWNEINRPIAESSFDALEHAVTDYLKDRSCYVQDLAVGADPRYQLPIRILTPSAWHALFAETMFIQPSLEKRRSQEPEFTILHAPDFQPVPEQFGLRSGTFIVVNFGQRTILIGGTQYAGEIKKSIFSIMNFLLPDDGVLPMHCSCNEGPGGASALFFGLSGTGKTTLSADPDRILVGDDEHGWSHRGIFNFEGGCYAKTINLNPDSEPEIYATTHMFGTILENVVMDPSTRSIDFSDRSITENTRAAFPLASIPNASRTGMSGHPANVIMLTADAFGVLPPVARLSTDQAQYYFLSGYTSKVAGTELGVSEPQATFSAGFGAPFLLRRPTEYADLLKERLDAHGSRAWLVNTGWTGGPYGVGRRMPIEATRAIVSAILNGALANASFVDGPGIGLSIPTTCPGVSGVLLDPRSTWADTAAFDRSARKLASMFADNFSQFEDGVSLAVASAGPRV